VTGTIRLPASGRADRLAAAAVWTAAVLVAGVFLWVTADVAARGLAHLSWDFVLEAPRDAGRAGGILPILVSTALILAVCLAIAVPLAVGTAVLLAEYARQAGQFGALVRGSLEVLAGMPSIVFGLFGNALFTVIFGLGFSILSGGVTLACMVLPILVRTLEEGLRAVPDDYRRAAAALGLSQATVLCRLILPAAAPALVVGLVLGIGRALAETAALLFTSGYATRLPGSLLDSGRTLSIHVYDLAMNVPGGEAPAAASALMLVALLLVVNIVTTSIGHRWHRRRLLT
jgi:phosphate transport system permease protein